MGSEVESAMNVLRERLKEDPSYAHTWHCNLAMMCYDAIKSHDVESFDPDSAEMSHKDAHEVGNDAASRFMKLCFNVETNG